MKVSSIGLGLITGIISAGIFLPAYSQVTSDGTTNTTVNTNGNHVTILNGIEKGNNLFHSFSNFSIPTGGSAKFDLVNTPNITTIFSRVTGGNVSNIDGLIQTLNSNNPASLFLMNPNGIVFGENAKLDIGASFVGTTANSIKFSDGTEFSAVNPTDTPLLTMGVPVGLQMGTNSGNIQVQGTGHNLSGADVTAPLIRSGDNSSGLSVKPGNLLALIAANVNLNGGILTANGGHVELAAAGDNSQINLNGDNSTWNFNYAGISNFGNINLTQKALADASGTTSGLINIRGQNLSLKDGSVFVIQNQGSQIGGDILVETSESVELIGTAPNTVFRSGFLNDALSTGTGGNITVSTGKLEMREDGGIIAARTFADGNGGDISIHTNNIEMIAGEVETTIISSISSGNGNSGAVDINTGRLFVLNGGGVSAAAFTGSASAGKITINATESIELAAPNPTADRFTLIGASALNPGGNAGSITINTSRLVLADGSLVSTSVFGSGDAGEINITATQSIQMSGKLQNTNDPTEIRSAAVLLPETVRRFLRLPDTPTGKSGDVTINTLSLQVTDGALLSVRNDGIGNAGNLYINAGSLLLNNQGEVSANTASGEGGNIIFNLQESLIMRNSSLIDTEAFGTGNGGNITINSPVIAGFENSDIIANAVEGNGGNIDITTQGIFGLEFRNQLTDESDITASSQFGVNGTVDIKNFGTDPGSGLVELPIATTDPSQQIASGCADTSSSSFIATGRGGIPENPNQNITSDRTWSDIRDISAFRQDKPVSAEIPIPANPIIQATSWRRNAQGQVELIAESPANQVQKSLTCAAVPQS